MTTYTITSGNDTYSSTLSPNKPLGSLTGVVIQGTSAGYGFIYFPLPADLIGQTVASATLTGHTTGVAASSLTIAARLVTSQWSDATLTANRLPTVSTTHVDTVVPATSIGDSVNLDLTALLSSVSAGTAWYGIRLDNPATATIAFQSFEYGSAAPWVLTVVTSEAPDVPQSLVPNGTSVGKNKPTVSCDFVDNGGLSTSMAAINVQVDPAQNGSSPAFDSGTVATTVPLLDLSTTSFTAMTSGVQTYWRVRVQDGDGLWSGWSDWAGMTYRAQPTLTLLTPAAGVLWDPTSDVIASTSTNMSAYRVQITDGSDRTNVRFDTGKTTANPSALTTIDVPLPEKWDGNRILVDDRDYQLHIQAWDTNLDRQGTPGSPAYVELWSTFHFDDDLTVTPVATLLAEQNDTSPAVTLTWTRASAGDAWVVLRDGKVIARLDPADTIAGVSTWTWTDPHPAPQIEHTYHVKAISGGKQGDPGPAAFITPVSKAIWLFTQDGSRVWLGGNSTDSLTVSDNRSTYQPINLPYAVDVVHGLMGLGGTFSGLLVPDDDEGGDQDIDSAVATLLSIRENPGTSVRLIFGRFSGDVLLRNLSITPSPLATDAVPVMVVSFGVNHVGDFDSVL